MLAGVSPRALWRSRPSILPKRFSDRGPSTPPAANVRIDPESPPLPHQDAAELEELNACLAVLTELFPDVRPEVFREMLASFSKESRLEVVVESLLHNRAQYVRNRLRLQHRDSSDRERPSVEIPRSSLDLEPLPNKETFRSQGYKAAVTQAFYQEFKGIPHSNIKAVLAENNYSYVHTRRALAHITTRSWRYSVVNLFMRRRVAPQTPLIEWTNADGPVLRPTTSRELNEELLDAFVRPMQRQKLENRLAQDKKLAEQLNEEEAQGAAAMFDCSVCYTSNTWENISVCDGLGSHYICFRCIRLTVKEALFGQGWSQSIDDTRSTLRCVSPANDGDCRGCLSRDSVQRALNSEPESVGFWQKLEDKILVISLRNSELSLAKCPFCPYAVVRDVPADEQERILQILRSTFPYSLILLMSFITLLYRPLEVPRIIWLVFQAFTISVILLWADTPQVPFLSFTFPYKNAVQRPNSGRKFICRNASCGRVSCLSCSGPWRDIHSCHSSSRQSLRTYVEAAISEAVKRTCPKCNLSFVKAAGCNKLVCVCGYAMCYICRSHIGTEGYSHFCTHFRPDGGTGCLECAKCDLYKDEDEETVVAAARQKAEEEWWGTEGLGLGEGKRVEWEKGGVLGDMAGGKTKGIWGGAWLCGLSETGLV